MRNPGASRIAGTCTILVFGALSVASGSPKSDSSASPASSTTTTAAGGDPSKGATFVGSCDETGNYHLDCSEYFAPAKADEEKKKCESRAAGSKWHEGPCPRLKAQTQCFQGNAPHLFGHYDYEGNKRIHTADDCPRGFRDFRKDADPNVKAGAPMSCDAIKGGGTCTQFSALDAKSEKSCIESGGRPKQPPEPCPTTDVLATVKITNVDGTTETETYYSTPWGSSGGTWSKNEVLALCRLVTKCEQVANPSSAPAASVASAKGANGKGAAPAAAPAKAKAKTTKK